MDAPQDEYQIAAGLIQEADVILITAGAGMGVGSGIGTFRGVAAGIWPPLERLGLQFPDMSNPARFQLDDKYGPKLAWSFWKWRYCAYTGTEPHDGYKILKSWCDTKKFPGFVFTSNIDGHFERAGFEGSVAECHGTVKFLQCQGLSPKCPNKKKMWLPDPGQIENLVVDPNTDEVTSELPKCPGCGTISRPTVMMFGDWGVLTTRINEQDDSYREWLHKIRHEKLVIIEVGAGIAIPTVRCESEMMSRKFGCSLIRINPEHPEISRAAVGKKHVSIKAGAEASLVRIDQELKKLNPPK